MRDVDYALRCRAWALQHQVCARCSGQSAKVKIHHGPDLDYRENSFLSIAYAKFIRSGLAVNRDWPGTPPPARLDAADAA